MSEPRGIRNNNPGNIRWGAEWQGLVPESQRTDRSFCQFIDAKWGIRAIAKIMTTYQDKYGLKTVKDIINRWAPPNENNTGAYVEAVAHSMLVSQEDKIDVHDFDTMLHLVKAIIFHENGIQPYPAEKLNQGIVLAGIGA